MKVRLRIDSLTLEGLAVGPHQERALRAALETELAARFAGAAKFAAGHHHRLTAEAPEFATQTDLLGRQIARAIHGSVPRHAE